MKPDRIDSGEPDPRSGGGGEVGDSILPCRSRLLNRRVSKPADGTVRFGRSGRCRTKTASSSD
jgi:hypothetical protein